MSLEDASAMPHFMARRQRAMATAAALLVAAASIAGPMVGVPRGVAAVVPRTPAIVMEPVDQLEAALGSAGAAQGVVVRVPILVYHYVRVERNQNDPLGIRLSVTPAMFEREMALLKADGGHTITFAELLGAMSGRLRLPPHPVILTFDDGYADFATAAAPILQRYGFTAIDYVVSDFINRRGYMSAEQVLQMDAAGMVMGSHTAHHLNLASVPAAIAQAEIVAGKTALEHLLGHPVLDFAYPYGGFSAQVVADVQQAGFRDAVTTMGGARHTMAGRYQLRRTHMGGPSEDLSAFAAAAGIPDQLSAVTGPVAGPSPTSGSAPPDPRRPRGQARSS